MTPPSLLLIIVPFLLGVFQRSRGDSLGSLGSLATQLLGNGVDIKTAQHRLGHVKASLTLDMYAHAIPANNREAAAVMGGLTGAAARKKAEIISIEEYEARTKRRKKRVAERKPRTHGRRERTAS